MPCSQVPIEIEYAIQKVSGGVAVDERQWSS